MIPLLVSTLSVYCFLFFNLQLRNPHSESPPFRFGTVPDGSTALNLKKNHPDMYAYMENYNKGIVRDGIKAVKNKYVCKIGIQGNQYKTAASKCMFNRLVLMVRFKNIDFEEKNGES